VSQAYEGTLVNAVRPQISYEGLYYSLDSGVTWNLATITDGSGADVQGRAIRLPGPTAMPRLPCVEPGAPVVCGGRALPRLLQSPDGVTWTRLVNQPGLGFQPRSAQPIQP